MRQVYFTKAKLNVGVNRVKPTKFDVSRADFQEINFSYFGITLQK